MNVNNNTAQPWYRYPLVWMMIVIPFSAVVMGVIMIWLAITTDDGLVADDYYKQGMAINRDLQRDTQALEKGIGAALEINESEGLVRVNLALNKGGLEDYPDTLQLKLQYATHDHNDIQLVLNHGQNNQYIGIINQPLIQGKWYLELSDGGWRLNGHMNAGKQIKLLLEP
ncbi:MAG: FixH family protein [Gammaproteobacteria bacterium]|nr:FixH family protein [Gammaproteobacteria bacterium]